MSEDAHDEYYQRIGQEKAKVTCKGSFMLGTACGTCSRCLENLEQIRSATGLIHPDTVRRYREQIDDLHSGVERLKEKNETLEQANETLKRRVASLEADRT
jgi:predicted RNase H-like nuclease (RuvC/YqgF family)